ncbi:MAG: hypothetical protein SFW62_01680 [Alphaproteobacteria bacterium]|nr:hypothetical protein [Alphaproteobacteria bacterium]
MTHPVRLDSRRAIEEILKYLDSRAGRHLEEAAAKAEKFLSPGSPFDAVLIVGPPEDSLSLSLFLQLDREPPPVLLALAETLPARPAFFVKPGFPKNSK